MYGRVLEVPVCPHKSCVRRHVSKMPFETDLRSFDHQWHEIQDISDRSPLAVLALSAEEFKSAKHFVF